MEFLERNPMFRHATRSIPEIINILWGSLELEFHICILRCIFQKHL